MLLLAALAAAILVTESFAAGPTPACSIDFSDLGLRCDASRVSCGGCADISNRLNFAVAWHVRNNGTFLLESDAAASACISRFQEELGKQGLNTGALASCGVNASVLSAASNTCPRIVTPEDFRKAVPAAAISGMTRFCSNFSSLESCSACYASATSAAIVNSSSSCLNYASIYASSVVNRAGPRDPDVAFCFFQQQLQPVQRKRNKHVLLVSLLPTALVLLAVVLLVLLRALRKRRQLKRMLSVERSNCFRAMVHHAVEFRLEELSAATGNFALSNRAGQGRFGNVYAGMLPDGTRVAVKRLKNSSAFSGAAEFVNELQAVGGLRHRNLVPLLGWCVHDSGNSSSSSSTRRSGLDHHHQQQQQRFIVYELMPRGSLDQLLQQHSSAGSILPWRLRKRIISGVARGLAYLHSGVSPALIHRDVKASNILLDDAMEARLSDLGLARVLPPGTSSVRTGVVGTKGYIAPEYVLYGQLNDRSDVYAFGVVLLQLVTGQKALVPPLLLPLAEWVWGMLLAEDDEGSGRSAALLWGLQQEEEERAAVGVEMERYLRIGLLCAHPYVASRPAMLSVLKMLEDSGYILPSVLNRYSGFICSQWENKADKETAKPGTFGTLAQDIATWRSFQPGGVFNLSQSNECS